MGKPLPWQPLLETSLTRYHQCIQSLWPNVAIFCRMQLLPRSVHPAWHPLSAFFCATLENCSMQKKGNIDNSLRSEKSCETTPTSKIDYGGWLHRSKCSFPRGNAGRGTTSTNSLSLFVCPQCTKWEWRMSQPLWPPMSTQWGSRLSSRKVGVWQYSWIIETVLFPFVATIFLNMFLTCIPQLYVLTCPRR